MKAQSFLPQMSLDCPVILETLKRTHLLFNLGSWQVAPSAGDVATLKKKKSPHAVKQLDSNKNQVFLNNKILKVHVDVNLKAVTTVNLKRDERQCLVQGITHLMSSEVQSL